MEINLITSDTIFFMIFFTCACFLFAKATFIFAVESLISISKKTRRRIIIKNDFPKLKTPLEKNKAAFLLKKIFDKNGNRKESPEM